MFRYMTDGMLLRESAGESAGWDGLGRYTVSQGERHFVAAGHNSGLRACSIVVLDEAHEFTAWKMLTQGVGRMSRLTAPGAV